MLKNCFRITLLALWFFAVPCVGAAMAQAPAENPINSGDTAWVLISTALVILMTPGLAFFYGGLVRSRNVLNTMMMSLVLMAIVGVTWVLWGYSLAFSVTKDALTESGFAQGLEGMIGNLNWMFLNGVEAGAPDPIGYAATIPHQLFAMYQMAFAIITPALISGAIVERMSFKAYFWFVLLWSTVIYSPLAHWVWGRGLIQAAGSLDFAGGTVVHISSGVAAVVAVWVLGSRKNYPAQSTIPHNVPFVLLGIGILWFGWFGFNAGSAHIFHGRLNAQLHEQAEELQNQEGANSGKGISDQHPLNLLPDLNWVAVEQAIKAELVHSFCAEHTREDGSNGATCAVNGEGVQRIVKLQLSPQTDCKETAGGRDCTNQNRTNGLYKSSCRRNAHQPSQEATGEPNGGRLAAQYPFQN